MVATNQGGDANSLMDRRAEQMDSQQQRSGHQALAGAFSTERLRNETAAIRREATARGMSVLEIEQERFAAREAERLADAQRVNALLGDPTALAQIREVWRSGGDVRTVSVQEPEVTPEPAQPLSEYERWQRWEAFCRGNPHYDPDQEPPSWFVG